MHQVASDLISIFFSPFNWICLLIVAPLFIVSARKKKACRLAALFIFLLFSNQLLINKYAKLWQPAPRDVSADKPYSCAILLGGFGSPDENGNGYFNIASDRFIQAVKLYKLGKAQHLLISGGNGQDVKGFSEAAWAKEEMKIMGVPDSVILYEDKSENTADNVINTKRLLDSVSLKGPYLLVTSAYHIPRASLIFKNAGINTVAFPCNYMAGRDDPGFWGILPDPRMLLLWNAYLKETVGYFYYYCKGSSKQSQQ